MAKTYRRSGRKQNNLLYTIIASVLICTLLLSMVASLYSQAEAEAYEMLHIQTKQIKDDLILQLKSDQENLSTMASFASKLNARGEDYTIMFDSFKPIGLYSRIGILTPECKFITKDGTIDLSDRMNFEQEVSLGAHITGRTYSYSVPDEQVVRASVPFYVNGRPAGIMYGIVKIEDINNKYRNMAGELGAQLFVYDKSTGKYVIDTFSDQPGEVSELKDRKYNDGSSYDMLMKHPNGFLSFKSIRTGENLYVHFSTIDDLNWTILLGRYETIVFEAAHKMTHRLALVFMAILTIIILYILLVLKGEREKNKVNEESSAIRKLLLEINENYTNITEATKKIKEFSVARSAFYVDTDGEDFFYIKPSLKDKVLGAEEKAYFHSELFKYSSHVDSGDDSAITIMQIIPNRHLEKTNPELYSFMLKHEIKDVTFAIITDKNNHVGILGTINPARSSITRRLLDDVAVCFSIAIYNKKHLSNTELAATTDSLTGAYNRVSYKKDIVVFDRKKPEDFSCIYIDVNELHLINNKYGHAAGDEMLIYIANTLKEVFFGQHVYRMGGDEFLVFAENTPQDIVKESIVTFNYKINQAGYHVALGLSYRSQNNNCEEMVREAELRMYDAKARYYQTKDKERIEENSSNNFTYIKTGIREIDTMISVLKEHYNGIYRVSLDSDSAHRILMPSYLGYKENEKHFSKLITRYVNDAVHPDFRRAVMSFLNFETIKSQIAEGETPAITYKKSQGDTVTLSIYNLSDDKADINETLWVFSKN